MRRAGWWCAMLAGLGLVVACDDGGEDGGGDQGVLLLGDAEVPFADAEVDAEPPVFLDAEPLPPPDDDAGPDDAFVPDAFIPPVITSCDDVCARYDDCGRLDDVFGDEGACQARCQRLQAAGLTDPWFGCLRAERCPQIQLCGVPQPPAPTCDALCTAVDGCGLDLPFDCAATCAERGDDFRQCGVGLVESCEDELFATCTLDLLSPDCVAFCQPQTACGEALGPCVGACIEAEAAAGGDPLHARRRAARTNCMTGAAADCTRVSACATGDSDLAWPSEDRLCAAFDRCNYGDAFDCREIGAAAQAQTGLHGRTCVTQGFERDCPFDPFDVFDACTNGFDSSALPLCQAMCGDLEACGQPRAECVAVCRSMAGMGGDSAEADLAWLRCVGSTDCAELTACVDATGPAAECAATCGRLAECGDEDPGCVERCRAGWARDRQADWRACVDGAADCAAAQACAVAPAPPCGDYCATRAACGADTEACVPACDDLHRATPDRVLELVACGLSADGCQAASPDGHGVASCDAQPEQGLGCVRYCRARSTVCDPEAEQSLEACIASCGPDAEAADRLRFRIARACLEALDAGADCAALDGCIPEGDPLGCPDFCTQVDACGVGPSACATACAEDALARSRVTDLRLCLEGAALDCGGLDTCGPGGDVIVAPPPGPPPFDEDAFCRAYSACGLDFEFPCEEIIFFARDQPNADAVLACGADFLARGCPFSAFDLIDACFDAGPGPDPTPDPILEACTRLCAARGLCEPGLDKAACAADCRGGIDADDPDAVRRATPRLACGDAWSCADLATCLRDASPEGICERHCAALDGCGAADDSCADVCVETFARRRGESWRACVTGADDCAAVEACSLGTPPPCDVACARLDDCGLAADRCVDACDDESIDDRLLALTRIACITSAATCDGADGGPSVADCLDDPEPGGAACTTYCRATTECEAGGDFATCLTRCADGFPDAEALRFAAAAPCLEGVRPTAQCAPLLACLPGEVEGDCAAHCARQAVCGVAAEDCEATCEAAPDLDAQGCVVAGDLRGRGCRAVAACVGWEGPDAGPDCAALCARQRACDPAVDLFLCERTCTPAPEALGVQAACAAVAGCAGLADCAALDATPVEGCDAICAAACGAFGEGCGDTCAGRAQSPAAGPTYVDDVLACVEALGAGCAEADGAACFEPARCDNAPIAHRVGAEGGVFQTDTRGRPNGYSATCAGSAQGGEEVIVLNLAEPTRLAITITQADYDTALHIRSACDDPQAEIACDDDGAGDLRSRIDRQFQAGTYFIFVDGFGQATGTATVQIGASCVADAECPAGGRCALSPPVFPDPCGCPDGAPDCFDCFNPGDVCLDGVCTPAGVCVPR